LVVPPPALMRRACSTMHSAFCDWLAFCVSQQRLLFAQSMVRMAYFEALALSQPFWLPALPITVELTRDHVAGNGGTSVPYGAAVGQPAHGQWQSGKRGGGAAWSHFGQVAGWLPGTSHCPAVRLEGQ
jgi:hypothetical protein